MEENIKTARITGRAAISYASVHGLTLSSHTDPTAEGRDGLSVEDAESIAAEDASLIYVDVGADTIEALRTDALAHGDSIMADLCDVALSGEDSDGTGTTLGTPCTLAHARHEVARVLGEAAAQS